MLGFLGCSGYIVSYWSFTSAGNRVPSKMNILHVHCAVPLLPIICSRNMLAAQRHRKPCGAAETI